MTMDLMEQKVPADLKSKVKETYDTIATEYNEWTGRNEATREDFLRELLKLLPDAQGRRLTVLELGCGDALTSTRMLLSRPEIDVIANDMSATQIGSARKNLALSEFAEVAEDRVTFKEGDMMQLCFPNGSLDAVVGLYSLIHLPRHEQSELLTRISSWLRPGGHMLVNFMSNGEEIRVNPNWLAEKGWMFWSGWGVERTTELVKAAGFDMLKAELRGDVGDASFFWVIVRKK
ncbi:putative methyltransferase type 11 [Diaporthe ampelina]|uniref:Putative methyltransferase type 11 n=1 Tax=Diaporthe ampelina TaxID=1214573 RepID=A0A0G2I6R9_9PEZI|nr:putative methyltransferase type 11 [Diaporthe ampelina]